MRETKNIYRILSRKPLGKDLLGRPKMKLEDNVTMIMWRYDVKVDGTA
jgi:hypothetical protein